tara:strand:+ start:402 stop:851 length:450 start_codon:yes stop_codon:yes gene_type:complete
MKNNPLDFEINLLPIISLLAVCISFLLLTAVWVPLGSLGTSQAIGQQTNEKNSKKELLSIWVQFDSNSSLKIFLRDNDFQNVGNARKVFLKKETVKQDTQSIIDDLVKRHPQIDSAILAPDSTTALNSIIQVMDILKSKQNINVGVSPI